MARLQQQVREVRHRLPRRDGDHRAVHHVTSLVQLQVLPEEKGQDFQVNSWLDLISDALDEHQAGLGWFVQDESWTMMQGFHLWLENHEGRLHRIDI